MQYRHYDGDGRARFLTFRTHRQLPVLTNEVYCRELARCIDEVRSEIPFRLIGYVFMPEHVHLVLLPRLDTKVGVLVGEIKRRASIGIHVQLGRHNSDLLSTLSVHRNESRRFVLWKRRCYDHNCRTVESMWQKVDYCHKNPVKRNLVVKPENWPWSSNRWYQGQRDVTSKMDVVEMQDVEARL